MEMFKWQENMMNICVRMNKIQEENKKLYLLFIDQRDPSLKIKLKGTEGHERAHNTQDCIKLLELIMSVDYGVEAHLQGNWATMKSENFLYEFFQKRNRKNYDFMKQFEAYIKVIDSYGGKTPIHPGLVNAKLAKMEILDTKNPTL